MLENSVSIHANIGDPDPNQKSHSASSDLGLYCLPMSHKKEARNISGNPLYPGNPSTGTFTNSEGPDEMQHNAAFHQGLH